MKKRLILAVLMLVLVLGVSTALADMIDQEPVRIEAPSQAALGETLEIAWTITDGNFTYDEAQVMITEIKDHYRAFRSEDVELSGRSGTIRYTPTAGDTLEIRINFMDSEYNILYTWERKFELTGTPTYDLRMIDGTVTFSLNAETKELEAQYALNGGNGTIQQMEYMWELYPEGGSSAEFYREGRMNLESSSGTMMLTTAVPGKYCLAMNLYDESGWIKRIGGQEPSFTISAAEGNENVSAEILPLELDTSEEAQELTWKIRGGYTPFYHCDVNLQILDPNDEEIYSGTTEYATEGTVSALLQNPGTYSAVFRITTCDKDGNNVVLDPLTVLLTVKSSLSLQAEAEQTYHVMTGECEFGWISEPFGETAVTGITDLNQPAINLSCIGPDGNPVDPDTFGFNLRTEILAVEWNDGDNVPAEGDYACELTMTAPGFTKTVSFTVHVVEIEAPSGYNMETRWDLELNRTYTLNAEGIKLYPEGWYTGTESPVIFHAARFVNGEGDRDDLDQYMDFNLSPDGKTFTYKPIRAGVYDVALHCRLDYFEFYQQTTVVVPDENGHIPAPDINLMTTGRGLYFIYPDGGNMSMDEGLFGSWVGNGEALRIAGAGEGINIETCSSVQQDAANPQQLRLKTWIDEDDNFFVDLAEGEQITVPGTYRFTFTVGWGSLAATDDFTLTAEIKAQPSTTFSMASELDYTPGEPLVLDPNAYSFDSNDWCKIGDEMLDWLYFSAFIPDNAAQAGMISQRHENGNLVLTISEAAVISGRLMIEIGDGQIGVYSFPLTLKAEGVQDPNRIGENVTYTMDMTTGTLIISGTGPMYDFDGEEVPPWYEVRDQIKTVTIGENVTSVGEYAFRGCPSLQTVTMASVKKIGMAAFQECSALESVVFSRQLEEIDTYAFDQCPALTSVTLPASLKRLEGAAFAECGLRQILAEGSTLTWHFFYAEENGFELHHIDLPAGLEVVGEGAFFSNPLQHDTPDFVTPSALQTVEDEAFAGIAARYVWLSENVTGIGKNAFAGCPDLKYVYIPIDCASIEEGAFPSGTILMGFADDERIAWAQRNGWTWITPEDPFGGNG